MMDSENKGVVLLVEDNIELNDSNRRALSLHGYRVLTATSLTEARKRLAEEEPDVILLDVTMPDGDGFDFCNEIRSATSAHILFLTARTEHENMVRGLAVGGDDYISKPFHLEELLARVYAAIRRRKMDRVSAKVISKGLLVLDVIACRAYLEGKDLLLSQKEFSILLLLIQNEGTTLSAEYIYESVWKQPMGPDTSALHTAVYRLRKKMEQTGYDIASERKKGYTFEKI